MQLLVAGQFAPNAACRCKRHRYLKVTEVCRKTREAPQLSSSCGRVFEFRAGTQVQTVLERRWSALCRFGAIFMPALDFQGKGGE